MIDHETKEVTVCLALFLPFFRSNDMNSSFWQLFQYRAVCILTEQAAKLSGTALRALNSLELSVTLIFVRVFRKTKYKTFVPRTNEFLSFELFGTKRIGRWAGADRGCVRHH